MAALRSLRARMRPLAALTALCLCARPSPAAAAEPSARLEVRPAPEGCPDAATLTRTINAILGRSAILEAPGAPLISVAFSRGPEGFRASLALLAPDGSSLGTRELQRPGRGCAALEGPVAVVGALLVDLARDSIQLQIPAPSPEEQAAVTPAPPLPAEPPRPAPAPPPGWAIQGEVAATAILGLLPGVAPGIRSDLRAARGGPLAGVARLDFWPSRASSGAGPGGDFSAWTAGLGLCASSPRSPSLVLEGCGLVSLGGMQGAGRGTSEVRVSHSWLALVGVDGALRWRLAGPLWGRLGLGGSAGHRPERFVFEGEARTLVVHRTWPVAFLASLGIVLESGSEISPR